MRSFELVRRCSERRRCTGAAGAGELARLEGVGELERLDARELGRERDW